MAPTPPASHAVLVTADTIRDAFGVSRATAFRRFAELVAEVQRGERPGAELVDVPVTRGNGAQGTARGVRLPVEDRAAA